MNRRDAMKALAAIAPAAGMSVTPITTREAEGAELVIIRVNGSLTYEGALTLKNRWYEVIKGTSLEHTKAIVMGDGMDIEIVRRS